MVNFSGLEFIFRFLPVFLIIYWIIPSRYRDALLFAGSLVFYAFGAKLFVILLFLLVLVNYVLGEMVWVMPGRRRKVQQRQMLVTIVTVDVIVLIVFKILALKVKASLLPLGLSFYIFKMISYQADLYLGRMRRRPSFMQAAAYFTMFPQIAQGPIMRFSQGWIEKPTNVRRQTVYIERSVSLAKVEDGICFFAMGLGMKILIADRLGILWNEIIKIGFESISTPLAWLGAVGYSLELYFDFWGYSLMAAGIGLMLGFRFVQNFIHPYAACGIADFYRRWHATLGSWFRDYVYIPLGGSRCGTFAVIRNLMIVWLLTGFWQFLARRNTQLRDLGPGPGAFDRLGEICREGSDQESSSHRTSSCDRPHPSDLGDLRDQRPQRAGDLFHTSVSFFWNRNCCESG